MKTDCSIIQQYICWFHEILAKIWSDWLSIIFTHFSQQFCEDNKSLLGVSTAQCGKVIENRITLKNFRKINYLVLLNFFCKNVDLTGKCKKVIVFTYDFSTLFFPSKQFRVNFFSKKLIWRNFCEKIVAVKLRHFHSVCIVVTLLRTFMTKISWTQHFDEVTRELFSRNISSTWVNS